MGVQNKNKTLFQSTRPWGARPHVGLIVVFAVGFNPRARGGRDKHLANGFTPRLVSIHAPVGGATETASKIAATADVSIHAPVGGATIGAKGFAAWTMFQSTRPWGARHGVGCDVARPLHVSIHAPVGGAT